MKILISIIVCILGLVILVVNYNEATNKSELRCGSVINGVNKLSSGKYSYTEFYLCVKFDDPKIGTLVLQVTPQTYLTSPANSIVCFYLTKEQAKIPLSKINNGVINTIIVIGLCVEFLVIWMWIFNKLFGGDE